MCRSLNKVRRPGNSPSLTLSHSLSPAPSLSPSLLSRDSLYAFSLDTHYGLFDCSWPGLTDPITFNISMYMSYYDYYALAQYFCLSLEKSRATNV